MPASDPKSPSRSVLVVDDDPNVLALLTSILEGPKTSAKPRIRVLRARTVQEATEVLSRSYVPVDLILSNQNFSADERESIVDSARKLRPLIPVLYMSAMSDETTVRVHGLMPSHHGDEPAIDRSGLLRAVVAAFDPSAVLTATARH